MKGGSIHPSDKSDGILSPSTPRYKKPGGSLTNSQKELIKGIILTALGLRTPDPGEAPPLAESNVISLVA